jgi:hypothetical protein
MARMLHVASLALAGLVDEGGAHLAHGKRIASILNEPHGIINWLGVRDRERLREGLKLAGWSD